MGFIIVMRRRFEMLSMECKLTPELGPHLCVSLCSFLLALFSHFMDWNCTHFLVWHGLHLPMDVSWTLFADIVLSAALVDHLTDLQLLLRFWSPTLPFGEEPLPILEWYGPHLSIDILWTFMADILLSYMHGIEEHKPKLNLALTLSHSDGVRTLYVLYIELTQYLSRSLLTVEQLLLSTLISILVGAIKMVDWMVLKHHLPTSANGLQLMLCSEQCLGAHVQFC